MDKRSKITHKPTVESQKRLTQKTKKQLAWNLFSEYSNSSTIHGIKYLGDGQRSWVERVWWVVLFCSSMTICGVFILKIYHKWETSPVIVSLNEKSTPNWQIPFPAVTICPETKVKSSILNITEIYKSIVIGNETMYDLAETKIAHITAVSQLCYAEIFQSIDPLNFTDCQQCIQDMREIALMKQNILLQCHYRSKLFDCLDAFEEIITEGGVCYSFNALKMSEIYREASIDDDFNFLNHYNSSNHAWSIEVGYHADAPLDVYPRRALTGDTRYGLNLLVGSKNEDLDYICRGSLQGFKILLHTPAEMPQVSKNFFQMPLNQELLVAIKPQMMITSEGLRHYTPERRQCYFNKERQLRFFKVYTQINCEHECLANFTAQQCGCIKFNMPRYPNATICGVAQIECMSKAEGDLIMHRQQQEFGNAMDECNCLPACTSITYETEVSQVDFDWKAHFEAQNVKMIEGVQLSYLNLYFKEDKFIPTKRSELYGRTDFIANCGGLLGLFMGVSLISIIEILYFCTIRLACYFSPAQRMLLKHGEMPSVSSMDVEKA